MPDTVEALVSLAGYVLPPSWRHSEHHLTEAVGHRLVRMNNSARDVAAAILMAPRQLHEATKPGSLLYAILMGTNQGARVDEFTRLVATYNRENLRSQYTKGSTRSQAMTTSFEAPTVPQVSSGVLPATQPQVKAPDALLRAANSFREAVLAKDPTLASDWPEIAADFAQVLRAAQSGDQDRMAKYVDYVTCYFSKPETQKAYGSSGLDGLVKMGFGDPRDDRWIHSVEG